MQAILSERPVLGWRDRWLEQIMRIWDPRRLLARTSAYKALQDRLRADHTPRRLVEEFLGVKSGDRILDIGCGPAAILEHLPGDIDYCGFDVEANYIMTARAQYGTRGRFFVGRVSEETLSDLGSFNVVMALAVLHHLSDAEVEALFSGAAKSLKPGGHLVTLDCAFVNGQHPVALLLAALDRGRFVRTPEQYKALAEGHFSGVEVVVSHDLLRVPYTHCIMKCCSPRKNTSVF